MSRLSPSDILELHTSAIACDLARDVLLSGIHYAFRSQLDYFAKPTEQLLSDLHRLNEAGVLVGGTDPLRRWLVNAIAVSKPRQECRVFEKHLASLGIAGHQDSGPSTSYTFSHRQIGTIASYSSGFRMATTTEHPTHLTLREFFTTLAYSFLSAHQSVGLAEFSFLMSLVAQTNRTATDCIDVGVSVCSHITAFVGEFESLTTSLGTDEFLRRTASYPDDLRVEYWASFGAHVPYTVTMVGPRKVEIRTLEHERAVFQQHLRTSDLLRYLSAMARGKVVVVDMDLTSLADNEVRFLRYTELCKSTRHVDLRRFTIDPKDPEKWDVRLP